jgi:Polysaccharide deacetylase
VYPTDVPQLRVYTRGVPFNERGGTLRGALDVVSGRFPGFVFGGRVPADVLPVFHFHDVTREDLEPKLRHLADNGYLTVTSDEIAAFVDRTVRLDQRSVALCFDDAWASLWDVAAPLLKQYGMRAIAYAIPARIGDADTTRPISGTASRDGSPFVTWPELRELESSSVVDVQCHTDTHSRIFTSGDVCGFVTPSYESTPFLNRPQLVPPPMLRFVTPGDLGAPLYPVRSRMSDGTRAHVSIDAHRRCTELVARSGGAAFFSRADWRAALERLAASDGSTPVESEEAQTRAIEEELDRGRATLNDRLKTTRVNHICLPWGVSGRRTAAALKRLGYRSAFANRLRGVHAVRAGDDIFWLKRLPNKYIFRLPGRGRRWF